MKTVVVKKTFALCLAVCLVFGILLLPVSAAETVEETPSNVIFWAEDMKEKLDRPNGCTTFKFAEADGMTVLELGIKSENPGNDPYISFTPGETYSTEAYKYVSVIARATVTDVYFELFYGTDGTGGGPVGGGSVAAKYKSIDDWQVLTFDLTGSAKWTGEMRMVRFDYFSGGQFVYGDTCQIAAMILSTDVSSAYDAVYEAGCKIYPPVQALSDFIEKEIEYAGKDPRNTVVTVNDGNLRYTLTAADDPYATFSYKDLVTSRHIPALTTDDFRYTVVRYRSAMSILKPNMELFVLTGNATSLVDMIRVAGTVTCHSGDTQYAVSKTYKAALVDMAEDDGLPENTGLKYGWQNRGAFTGFRFDWCGGHGLVGSYLEVSDFLFYANRADAEGMTQFISSMDIKNPDDIKNWEETYETEHIVMPWETETEDATEETVPTFPQDTTEVNTDEATESAENETTENETTENETTENIGGTIGGGDPDNLGGGDIGGIDISGGDQAPAEEGSQTPFLVACIVLASLSVVSIATVLVIRVKERA